MLLLGSAIVSAHGAGIDADKKPVGSDVRAHWVHLAGHFGNNSKMRAALIDSLSNCVAVMRKANMPHQEIPSDQIPQLIHEIETDTYIAQNRVMKIHRQTLVGYNPNDCSLRITHIDKAVLASMNGTCNINLTEKTASGVCDAAIHAGAASLTDLMTLQENASAATKARRPHKTGESKSIAGIQCDVYKSMPPLEESYCISTAGSFLASPIQSFGGTVPGLRLEIVSKNNQTQVATNVHLDTLVSPDIFSVPKGIKVKSITGMVPSHGMGRMQGVSQ
jgi:hypothetical protein